MDRITINQMVQNTIQQYGSKTALSHKVDKKYQDISYATLAERIKDFCLGLTELGLRIQRKTAAEDQGLGCKCPNKYSAHCYF